MLMKVCTKCEVEKYLDEFHNNKTGKFGKRSICKVCIPKYFREYYAKNADTIKEKHKKYYTKNTDAIRKRCKKFQDSYDKELKSKKNKEWRNSFALYKTYNYKLSYAEEVRDNNGLLELRCAYCNKWFTPKNSAIHRRINSLKGNGRGEARLYCSYECKQVCPTFKRQKYERGTKLSTSREVPSDFRKIALEDRNYTCEKCGSIENGLHVHHIEGYTEQPMFMADLLNVIVVCKKCHKEIHKQKGCSYQDYQCSNKKEDNT